MSQNINPETGIRYGIIAANSLHPDVVDQLQFGAQARDVNFEWAQQDVEQTIRRSLADYFSNNSLTRIVDTALEEFGDDFQDDEPVHDGVLDGVNYQTSWLGGALNVWVFESPVTGHFSLCSPCVPGACNLDDPDPDGEVGYDVPTDWRAE